MAARLFRIGIGAVPFLLPLMLQVGFGDSRGAERADHLRERGRRAGDEAGDAVACGWFGFRDTLLCQRRGLGGDPCALRRVPAGWPLAAIYAVLLVGGFFRSLQFTGYNTMAFADIPARR